MSAAEVLSGAVPLDSEVVAVGREAIKHGLHVWSADARCIGVGRKQTTLYDDLFHRHNAVRLLEISRQALANDGELQVLLARLARLV